MQGNDTLQDDGSSAEGKRGMASEGVQGASTVCAMFCFIPF